MNETSDEEFEAQLKGADKKTLAVLLRAARAETRAASAELGKAKREKTALLKAQRAKCKAARAAYRAKKREIQEAQKSLKTQEKAAVHEWCSAELERIRQQIAPGLAQRQAKAAVLRARKEKIEHITGAYGKRLRANTAARERRQESNEAVERDIEAVLPEAVGWWRSVQNRAHFSGTGHARGPGGRWSRTEAVLHYLHENPEVIATFATEQAEKKIRDYERKQKKLAKRQRQILHSRGARQARSGYKAAARMTRNPLRREAAPF